MTNADGRCPQVASPLFLDTPLSRNALLLRWRPEIPSPTQLISLHSDCSEREPLTTLLLVQLLDVGHKLIPGVYRCTFDTKAYFEATGSAPTIVQRDARDLT